MRVVLRAADVRAATPPATASRSRPTSRRRGPSRRTATSRWPIRVRQGTAANSRYTSARAGSTRNACSILARKAEARPGHRPSASQPQRVASASTARRVAYADPMSSSTSSASGLLNRNISTATGRQRQRRRPASRPAPARARRTPHRRVQQPHGRDALECLRAPGCSTTTARRSAPTAPSATAPSGVLSTVIEPAASEDAEEERLPRLRAGLGRGRVEGVRPPGRAEPPQVQAAVPTRRPASAARSTGTGIRPMRRAALACWFPGWSPGPRVAGRGRSMRGEVVMTSRSRAHLSARSRQAVSGLCAQRPSTSRSPGSRAGSSAGSASKAQSERFHSGTGVRQSSCGTKRDRRTSS